MFRSFGKLSVVAMTLAASLVVAQMAEAAGYATNGCVSQKQKALGKYTKSVGKAWDKYPADATARDTAIADALTKLEDAWSKAEAKAVKKNATCDGATSTAAEAAAEVDGAVSDTSADNYGAVVGYVSSALKANSKYIKDPAKDPNKVKLDAALSDASTDNLTGATLLVSSTATGVTATLVEKTTMAPDYPTTFQTIVPGAHVLYGKTQLNPICMDGSPYMYFAKRGTSKNVLMYYQGGGACWDATTCNVGQTCDRNVVASDNPANTSTGFADYDNPSNPFHDWSVVFISYCTCDVHWGQNKKDYSGTDVYHFGRVNAAVVEKFAREHFVDPDRVFVTGSSAGSYGAIMNSYWLMKDVWPNADFAVLGDAGVGVITKQWLETYIKNWGVEANFPTDLPGVSLPVENLSLVDLIDGLSQRFPNARFANYDSSYDGGGGSQTNFFQAMRYPNDLAGKGFNYWEPACEWNACMRDFKADNANRSLKYHYFTGAGSRHTIFGSDKVYTETKSTDVDGNGVTFASWVQAMMGDTPDWVDVSCNNLNGDCNLTNSCQGGDTPGALCTTNSDCTVGGTCEHDPDTTFAPYNNDGTVDCSTAPHNTCPCGPADARCFGGDNDQLACASNSDCLSTTASPNGTCSYVNCSSLTP